MLIKVSIENWMSFRDRVEFSMIATRERQHSQRVAQVPSYRLKILPIALLYGGNASGKTNFVKALNFARNLVVKVTQPEERIPVDPFLLGDRSEFEPSRFAFEILTPAGIFEYKFSVTGNAILEEKLVKIGPSSEQIIYARIGDKIKFQEALEKDERLRFAAQGTRDNQLFLTNSISQKIDNFRSIYEWFRDRLILIAPDSRFGHFEKLLDHRHPLHGSMSEILPRLDTGILQIGGESVEFQDLPFTPEFKSKLEKDLVEGTSVRLVAESRNERYIVSRVKERLVAKKLFSYHAKSDGSRVRFEIRQESDGSQRLIDLLPAFVNPTPFDEFSVVVIDEIDRSLHTLLTRQLLETFLHGYDSNSRRQILVTTHDVLLMDQSLLRRDEIWVTERDRAGVSTLTPFSDFKDVRYDKDLQKSYVQGRLGGIPRLSPIASTASPAVVKRKKV